MTLYTALRHHPTAKRHYLPGSAPVTLTRGYYGGEVGPLSQGPAAGRGPSRTRIQFPRTRGIHMMYLLRWNPLDVVVSLRLRSPALRGVSFVDTLGGGSGYTPTRRPGAPPAGRSPDGHRRLFPIPVHLLDAGLCPGSHTGALMGSRWSGPRSTVRRCCVSSPAVGLGCGACIQAAPAAQVAWAAGVPTLRCARSS